MAVPDTLSFNNRSRLMLFAPHPDDESLACSVLLQRAVAAGANIRIIYATDGDNNPWPQRVIHRKWRLTEFDRARWGQIRRAEANDALKVLGVPASSVEFLSLPDQGLTNLLVSGCERTFSRLAHRITEWRPTDLLWPDNCDTHPDHSALSVMLQIVLDSLPAPFRRRSVWTYAVHGSSAQFLASTTPLRQTPKETIGKITAIACHQTQLKLSSRRFLAYAGRPERFAPAASERDGSAPVKVRRMSDALTMTLPFRRRPSLAIPKLLLLGYNAKGDLRCVRIVLKHQAKRSEILECVTGIRLGMVDASWPDPKITLPGNLFSAEHGLYVKLQRRRIFFDEAGWIRARLEMADKQLSNDEFGEELVLAAS